MGTRVRALVSPWVELPTPSTKILCCSGTGNVAWRFAMQLQHGKCWKAAFSNGRTECTREHSPQSDPVGKVAWKRFAFQTDHQCWEPRVHLHRYVQRTAWRSNSSVQQRLRRSKRHQIKWLREKYTLSQSLGKTQWFVKIPPQGHVTAMAKALKDGHVPSQGAQWEDLLPLGLYYFLVQLAL